MHESERRPPAPFATTTGPTQQERADKRVGAVIVGKYRLETVLGVGGMAAVYRAAHRNGNRVAIKMLHAEVSADTDLRARFVREGYVANSIAHEGTVRVLDDDVTEDGAAFLVMDLLEGETLVAHAASRGGKLPIEQVVAIGDRILDVLVASHAAGVIHRDIKPENVFLTTEGTLHLLDFGVARVIDPTGSGPTRTGRVMGTPAFMPPEQALGRGKEIDERTDLWAVGATMLTLLTGHYVHEAETPEELIVKTATQPVRPIRELAPKVPGAIATAIDRALAFDKKDRFASAREMQAALAAAVKGAYGAMPALAKGSVTAGPRESIGHARTVDASSPDIAATGSSAHGGARPFDTADVTARRAPTRPSNRPGPQKSSSGPWLAIAAGSLAIAGVLGWRATRSAGPATTVVQSASPSPSPARCTANAQCAAAGPASICRKDTGACVALTSPDCSDLLAEKGDVENDATIWIGAMIPRHGPDGAKAGDKAINTLELARRDFVAISSGVPGVSPTSPSRPIGVVLCDDLDVGTKVAHHLVDDVGVPAVIGFARTKSVLDLTPSLFNAKHVLALAALNTSPILTSVPIAADGTRFLWRANLNAEGGAAAMGAFATAQVIPILGPNGGVLKAAIVRRNNAGNVSMGDSIVSHLQAHAKADLVTFLVDSEDPSRDVPKVATQVIGATPDYVVLLGGGDAFVPALVLAIEKGWPTSNRRPYYVGLSTGILEDDGVKKLAASSAEIRNRVLGVDSPASIPANVKLALHYNELFTPAITPATTFGPPYDAFYLLAYAIVAVGAAPVNGESLAKAIPRLLPPGEPVDVGPASILAVYNALRAGKNIDLNGTTTTLDLDVATGDAPADSAFYCLRSTSDHHGLEPRESGLVFEAKTQKLTGKLDCR